MDRIGFSDIWIGAHQPYGIADAQLYPLFTDEIVGLMRRLIPEERQGSVAISVIAKASKSADPTA